MSSDSDRLLIAQIRNGNPASQAAWLELITRYEGRLRAYVRRRLRDHAVTEDVVQETFIGFLNSLANYDDKRELQTWLFTIAAHKVTDQLRKLGRRPIQTGNESDDEMLGQEADVRQHAASSIARSRERRDLETTAVSRGLKELIHGFRQKGDHKRVMVLELLFVKGWPNYKVAEFLDFSEQQIANYRFAAVKKLTEGMRAAGLPEDVFPELGEGSSV